MSFWINDKLGIAFEFNEAGFCKWDPSSNSFNDLMVGSEMSSAISDMRNVSEDEAEAFARSHIKAEEPEQYPLSEEEFKRLRDLPQKELNKLPIELIDKLGKMAYMKRQEKGYLDWE